MKTILECRSIKCIAALFKKLGLHCGELEEVGGVVKYSPLCPKLLSFPVSLKIVTERR